MKAIIFATALALTACSNAPKSNEVAPDYISSAGYEKLDCERLALEYSTLGSQVRSATDAVDAHRNRQTGVEVVTWLLFWPAALALDKGSEHSSRLARLKGEQEAIAKSQRIQGCK